MSSSTTWVRVGPRIAEWGLYVIAPDLRGHGASPKPDNQYALNLMAGDLADSVSINPYILIGHSFGGVMAILAIEQGIFHPSYLILEDPVLHFADQEIPDNILTNDEKNLPRDVEGILKANPKWHRLDAEGKIASLQAINWDHMHQVFARNAPWDFRTSVTRLAKEIPVLLILPQKSFYVPEEDAIDITNSLGSDSVIHFPGAGHNIHRDNLEGFLDVIRPRIA
jgi:pimeloyl-ACP methyl ester carboxylesterase